MSLRFRVSRSTAVISTAAIVAAGLILPIVAQAGGGGTNIRRDTMAVVRDVGGVPFFFTRSSNDGTCTTPTVGIFGFGDPTDQFLAVDLDGDGQDQPGVYRDGGGFGRLIVRDEDNPANAPAIIDFGAETDTAVVGNLDPTDAGDEIAVFRTVGGTNFFFINTDTIVVALPMGVVGDLPIVGNWDDSSDGSEEVGLFRPSTNEFFLRPNNLPGIDNFSVRFLGGSGDSPITGDWDGDGRATPGVTRDAAGALVHFQTNGATGETIDNTVFWGDTATDTVLVGDWDGRGTDNDGC